MSKRTLQIESTLRRAISTVLAREISDPRITGLVSVTRVQISPDLHDAYVYVSVLPAKYGKRTLAGLKSATRHIQSLVLKQVALRAVPRIEFRLDEMLKKQSEVLAAIQRGMGREAEKEPGAAGAEGTSEDATGELSGRDESGKTESDPAGDADQRDRAPRGRGAP